LEWLGY